MRCSYDIVKDKELDLVPVYEVICIIGFGIYFYSNIYSYFRVMFLNSFFSNA